MIVSCVCLGAFIYPWVFTRNPSLMVKRSTLVCQHLPVDADELTSSIEIWSLLHAIFRTWCKLYHVHAFVTQPHSRTVDSRSVEYRASTSQRDLTSQYKRPIHRICIPTWFIDFSANVTNTSCKLKLYSWASLNLSFTDMHPIDSIWAKQIQ